MFNPNWPRPFLRPAAPDPVVAEPVRPARPAPSGRRADRDIVAFIDSRLDGQQVLAADDRNDELVDALLDIRNMLTVPAVPGRSA